MNDNPSRTPHQDHLRLIEDGVIDDILAMPLDELREELIEEKQDPDLLIKIARQKLIESQDLVARTSLKAGKQRAQAFKASSGKVLSLDLARKKFEEAQSGKSDGLMMAARKGRGLSANDEEALLEAMAELERLEGQEDNEE